MQERIAAGLPILVAETDPLIALDLEGRLREAGYTVVGPLYSPHELDKLAALPLAGAVLNSGALGPDVAASLKPLTKSGVPVLLISGYSDIDRHIGGEGVTVLSKPVDLHEIMEALREAVSRRIAKAHDYTSSADDPRAP